MLTAKIIQGRNYLNCLREQAKNKILYSITIPDHSPLKRKSMSWELHSRALTMRFLKLQKRMLQPSKLLTDIHLSTFLRSFIGKHSKERNQNLQQIIYTVKMRRSSTLNLGRRSQWLINDHDIPCFNHRFNKSYQIISSVAIIIPY